MPKKSIEKRLAKLENTKNAEDIHIFVCERNDLTVLEQGEHLARRQELVGYKQGENQFTSRGGDIMSPPKTQEEIATAV